MLSPGDIAPDFELPCAVDGHAGTIRARNVRSDYVAVFFYPHDFSFICPTEVTGFHRQLKAFEEAGCFVIGISVDSVESHLKWAVELGGIGYPLAADPDGKVARAFGVFDEKEKVAMRATFVLNKDGTVQLAVACPLNVGRSVDDTLRVVQAISTGQMCPAEWRPGAAFGPSDRKL